MGLRSAVAGVLAAAGVGLAVRSVRRSDPDAPIVAGRVWVVVAAAAALALVWNEFVRSGGFWE